MQAPKSIPLETRALVIFQTLPRVSSYHLLSACSLLFSFLRCAFRIDPEGTCEYQYLRLCSLSTLPPPPPRKTDIRSIIRIRLRLLPFGLNDYFNTRLRLLFAITTYGTNYYCTSLILYAVGLGLLLRLSPISASTPGLNEKKEKNRSSVRRPLLNLRSPFPPYFAQTPLSHFPESNYRPSESSVHYCSSTAGPHQRGIPVRQTYQLPFQTPVIPYSHHASLILQT